MCRYSNARYKAHYVCFNCRKGFKQPPIEDLIIANGDWGKYEKVYLTTVNKREKFRKENPETVAYLEEKYKNRVCRCPECGQEMKDVGLDLRTPKKDKVEEWKILQSMYALGKFFYSCGCSAYGFIPKDKKQYEEYLLKSKKSFQQKILKRDEKTSLNNLSEYLEYWNEKISEIDRELEKINS